MLEDLSIKNLSHMLRGGEISAVELAEEMLARIERQNPSLRPYITVCRDRTLKEARQAQGRIEAGKPRSPLEGIPYAAKDSIAAAGVRTTANSALLADWIPKSDDASIRRLREAGAVLLGKLTMNEYGYGGFRFAPWARNPYLPNRGAGGSSNGSASAVSGGLAVISLGTDGGGSIRIPAAMCNLTGLAPTPGRIDGSGHLPPAGFGRLRRVGPLCQSADDALIIDSVLAGGGEWPEEPPKKLGRLSAVEDHIRLDGDLREIYENALETMARELGTEIIDIDIPGFAESSGINWTFLAYNAWDRYGEFVMERRDKATPELFELIERGRDISEGEMGDALIFRRRFIADTRNALKKVGAIVTPTRPMAQRLEEAQDNSVDRAHANPGGSFTAPFNLAEFPALTFPCGFTADGAPIGIQLAGARNSDRSLLQLATAYQRITDWHRRPPEYL